MMNKLELELATIKMMIYSLYKTVTEDYDLEKLSDWENKCETLAKEILNEKSN